MACVPCRFSKKIASNSIVWNQIQSPADQLCRNLREIRGVDGFLHISLKTRIQDPHAILGASVARQSDRRDRLPVQFSEPASQGITIFTRHGDIADHQIGIEFADTRDCFRDRPYGNRFHTDS